jgi:anti-sigma regulatory factor (Ser/Thr protein kinase)
MSSFNALSLANVGDHNRLRLNRNRCKNVDANLPNNQSITVCVAARFSNVTDLLALISSSLSRVGPDFDHKIPLRAHLAVEELFANTIHHGYGRESDAQVWLTVETDAASLQITYVDAAAECDPFAGDFASSATERVADQRVGWQVRLFIKETARHCAYRREAGRNVITLEYALKPAV